MTTEQIVIRAASILVLATLCQWIAWRVKIPAILFLLITGIVLGPVMLWVDPTVMFGNLLFPMVSISVAIILFEGSMSLKFEDLRGIEHVVWRMLSVGMLSTWGVMSVAAYFLLNLSLEISLLFGSIMVVTGPTVVMPMLRSIHPKARVGDILRWEGILIDPLGALLAVLVYEFIVARQGYGFFENTLFSFAGKVSVGMLLGWLGAELLARILKRAWLPEHLHNLATLAAVITSFAVSNLLAHESGLLAVTVMGVWLGNRRDVSVEKIRVFKENISNILISILFILLAARIGLWEMVEIGSNVLWLLLVVQFVARPLKILLSTWGTTLTWPERALLAWVAPRGIVAAAVASIFSLRLIEIGFLEARLLVPMTFAVIIGTVLLQSLTSRPLAVLLKVTQPTLNGFLIIGANPVATTVGLALQRSGAKVVLADENWSDVVQARNTGLTVYYGNPFTERARQFMDLVGVGHLLALSHTADMNLLARLFFEKEMGEEGVYYLSNGMVGAGDGGRNHGHMHVAHPRQILFGQGITFFKLHQLVESKAEIHHLELTQACTLEQFARHGEGKAIPLYYTEGTDKARLVTAGTTQTPKGGTTLYYLARDPLPPIKANVEKKNGVAEKSPPETPAGGGGSIVPRSPPALS